MRAGRYRIVSLLGRGGRGDVYRAEDLELGQPVKEQLGDASIQITVDTYGHLAGSSYTCCAGIGLRCQRIHSSNDRANRARIDTGSVRRQGGQRRSFPSGRAGQQPETGLCVRSGRRTEGWLRGIAGPHRTVQFVRNGTGRDANGGSVLDTDPAARSDSSSQLMYASRICASLTVSWGGITDSSPFCAEEFQPRWLTKRWDPSGFFGGTGSGTG